MHGMAATDLDFQEKIITLYVAVAPFFIIIIIIFGFIRFFLCEHHLKK